MNILIGKILKERFYPLFFLLFVLWSSSCIREEVIDTIEIEQAVQPVVFCTLSPGDSIQLLLTRSTTFFDEPSSIAELGIYDAEVSIFNEKGDTLQLQNPNTQTPIYSASQKYFPIIAGETYHLSIQRLESNEILTSSTTIPDKAVQWDSFEVYNERIVREENKSRVETWVDVKGSWSNQSYATKLIRYGQTSTKPDSIQSYPTGGRLVDDYYIRTNECCNNFQLEGIAVNSFYTDLQINYFYTLTYSIITLNQDLEDYYWAYEVHHENKESIDMNLFLRLFKGVFPEYTNIKGGLGVFGGYLRDSRTI